MRNRKETKKLKVKSKNLNLKLKSFFVFGFCFNFLLLTFSLLSGCQNKHLYEDTRVMMGTFVEVISPQKEAAGIVFQEVQKLDNLLSKYNPESEVSRLNKSGKLKVSEETFEVVKVAKEFSEKSEGAFDITVAPILDLWGFTDKNFRIPIDEEISDVLRLVGSDKIILHEKDSVIEFSLPDVKIDLGGIAKGFALDRAVKKLKENNIKSCLINAGGQIFALGEKFGEPWRVAIKNPRKEKYIEYLELKDQSVSTSGDYEQYFTKGKRRYSHIINPRTGYPVDSGVISVTVVSTSATLADCLSTAIFVLGKVKGEGLAGNFKEISEVKIVEGR